MASIVSVRKKQQLEQTEAAMLVTLSSRTNLSVKSLNETKEIRRIDSSGDAVPRAVPTSAALPVGARVGWKFPFVGCFLENLD